MTTYHLDKWPLTIRNPISIELIDFHSFPLVSLTSIHIAPIVCLNHSLHFAGIYSYLDPLYTLLINNHIYCSIPLSLDLFTLSHSLILQSSSPILNFLCLSLNLFNYSPTLTHAISIKVFSIRFSTIFSYPNVSISPTIPFPFFSYLPSILHTFLLIILSPFSNHQITSLCFSL